MYVYVYALNSHFVYKGHNRDTPVIYEKENLVCFIYKHPQKVKFKIVQINIFENAAC